MVFMTETSVGASVRTENRSLAGGVHRGPFDETVVPLAVGICRFEDDPREAFPLS